MTGRPVGAPTSDLLDRIEARFSDTPTPGLYEFNDATRAVVLALVAVARAAREFETPVGFIEALALGQYAASEETIRAARHYLPQAQKALELTRLDGAR